MAKHRFIDDMVEVRPAVSLRPAYEFFRQHAGYVVGENALGALRLARAELRACLEGYRFEWKHDPEPWDADDDCPPPNEVLNCCLVDDTGRIVASLCGIGDPDRSYRRVVEAELAVEAGLAESSDVVPG